MSASDSGHPWRFHAMVPTQPAVARSPTPSSIRSGHFWPSTTRRGGVGRTRLMRHTLRVAIIGGGIGGVAAANALRRRGIDARVYEQAPALKEVGAGVALHPNGVRMLRRLGFGDDLLRFGARWRDPQFRHPDGRLVARWWPSGEGEGIEIFGMHRADLLQMFLDRLPPEVIHP